MTGLLWKKHIQGLPPYQFGLLRKTAKSLGANLLSEHADLFGPRSTSNGSN